jgi:uncharacterized protein (TIGR03437 family)
MDLQLDSDGRVATSLAGTQVLFNGIRAPLLYVSDRQINTVVPFGVPVGKTVLVEVEAGGKKSAPLAVEIEPVAPEIFTVAGTSTAQAAALNQDGVPNSTDHPALQGSIISLFATGGGDVAPPLADGQLGPTPPSALAAPVQVLFGGVPGEVLFAGSAPGLVAGVIQINARIPGNFLPRPDSQAVGIVLALGTVASRGTASVWVR